VHVRVFEKMLTRPQTTTPPARKDLRVSLARRFFFFMSWVAPKALGETQAFTNSETKNKLAYWSLN